MKDKYRAQRLGARWDPARRAWYCPDGTDLTPLLRWVPGLPKLTKGIKRVLRKRVH
jgi:hypothetical protein